MDPQKCNVGFGLEMIMFQFALKEVARVVDSARSLTRGFVHEDLSWGLFRTHSHLLSK